MSKSPIPEIKRFVRREDGPTTVEYAVMLMLIITVCLIGIQLVGGFTAGSLQDSGTRIQQSTNGS